MDNTDFLHHKIKRCESEAQLEKVHALVCRLTPVRLRGDLIERINQQHHAILVVQARTLQGD